MAHGYDAGLMSSSDKAKLDSIDNGANKTTKLSQLENDTDFKTESEIQQMIEKASSLKKEVVTSLPTTGKDDVIYLVQGPKGKDNNNYLEYLWLNGKYELIGSTQVDLSGYVQRDELNQYENAIYALQTDMTQTHETLKHTLNTEQVSTIFPDPDPNKIATSGQVKEVFDTCTTLSNAMSQLNRSVGEYIDEQLKDTLKTSDIQEFTQQELEEAFK